MSSVWRTSSRAMNAMPIWRTRSEDWGLELWCRDARSYSPAVTVVSMPDGRDPVAFRRLVLDHFNVSLAMGLNKLDGKAFRFGHLGYTNDATIIGALAAVEMGLELPRPCAA